ncbi:MAG: 50S ribosomal protein L3 [Candidatus Aminicenantes bacterium]|nr:50S ribosomal protein L3 [Candidatus Aminicenantes bacterium]
MIEGLIGKKIGMTQTFDDKGNVSPITVIRVGPCTVIQKKTKEKNGYSALQLGLIEEKGRKKAIKPLVGHYEKAGVPPMKILREFQFAEKGEVKEGDQFFVDIFQAGEKVDVVGMSKGKGFAGVVKRWGFHGGKASHGSMFHRRPGSIGASAFPSRVTKGKKLPGQLGNRRVTVKNLEVIQADKENNLLVVKGSVPGASGGYLLIKKASFNPEAPVADHVKPEQPAPEKPKPEPPKPEEPKVKKAEDMKPEAEGAEKPTPEEPKEPKPEKPEVGEAEKPAPEKAKPEEPESEEPEKPEVEEPEKPSPEKAEETTAEEPEGGEPEMPTPEEPKEPKSEEPESEEPKESEQGESESSEPDSSKGEKKE